MKKKYEQANFTGKCWKRTVLVPHEPVWSVNRDDTVRAYRYQLCYDKKHNLFLSWKIISDLLAPTLENKPNTEDDILFLSPLEIAAQQTSRVPLDEFQ